LIPNKFAAVYVQDLIIVDIAIMDFESPEALHVCNNGRNEGGRVYTKDSAEKPFKKDVI
jgi:hypothetical protein